MARNKPSPNIASRPVDEDRWRAREDLSTLKRADEIRGDGSRMRACKTEAKREVKSLGKVIGPRKK